MSLTVATKVAFSSSPDAVLASGCETGAVFFFEIAQQVLFAQQPGRHVFCATTEEIIQVRAESGSGVASNAPIAITEIAILPNIG